ncbi:MAG: hypothetical protein JXR50_12250 [Prolixibacteraceae bacterium]|nr:hypothetical protein [Prolixibacteraceae bacterium]
MVAKNTNWADVYSSLGINGLKATERLMLIVTLVAGLLFVVVFYFLFRKQLVVVAIIASGALFFSGKYAVGLLRLSKKPKVYSGIVTRKTETSFTEKSTKTRYYSHRIRLKIDFTSELCEFGMGKIRMHNKKNIKINCSRKIFDALSEGNKITLVEMPHDKSIGWFCYNQ